MSDIVTEDVKPSRLYGYTDPETDITLYTISTDLVIGMDLYNNEGIKYTTRKVSEILTPDSFNILDMQRLNVEDYNYTDNDYNITLTKYIGTNSVVIAPELED